MDKQLFLNEYGIKKLLSLYLPNIYVFNERRTFQKEYEIVFNEKNNDLKELTIRKADNDKVEVTLTDEMGRIAQKDKYVLRSNDFIKLDHIIQVGKTYNLENTDKSISVLKQDKDRCILFSESASEPFIVAWGVSVTENQISWCGGSYRSSIDTALELFNEKSKSTMKDINNKLSELTSNSIDENKSKPNKEIDIIK